MTGTIKGFYKLNIGASTEDMAPGWLNISLLGEDYDYDGMTFVSKKDGIPLWKCDNGATAISYDMNQGLPFEDNSIKSIFSSHFLEHLPYEGAINFFKESHRVLCTGGMIRTICPDIKIWIQKYIDNDIEFFNEYKKTLNVDYHENITKEYHNRIKTNSQVLNSMIYNWGHKWMWDTESLTHELTEAGFKKCVVNSPLSSNMKGASEIELMLNEDKQKKRTMESLYIDAIK